MVENILKTSLLRGWVITIIYQKGDHITKRNIRVLDIEDNNIRAFCYLREQIRLFKLENILSASYSNMRENKIYTASGF